MTRPRTISYPLCFGTAATLLMSTPLLHALVTGEGVTSIVDGSTDESLVNNTDQLELAVNLGSTTSPVMLNGIDFTGFIPDAGISTIAGPNGVTFGGTSATGGGAAFRNLVHPLWNGGGSYTNLLQALTDNQSADFAGTLNFTFTGLDTGRTYRVDLFTGDSRNLGTTITHSLGGVDQSSLLTAGSDGMMSSFTVMGESSVDLTVTSDVVGGVPPTIQGVVVTSVSSVIGLSAPSKLSAATNGDPIQLSFSVGNSAVVSYDVTGLAYSGTAMADFSDSVATPLTVGAGGSENITVDFAPSAGGLAEATLTLSTDDPNNLSIEVALSVEVHDPEIAIDSTLDFGAFVALPGPTAMTVNVDNSGDTAGLNLSAPLITGPGAGAFNVSVLPGTIAAGGSDLVEIIFEPPGDGLFVAQLTLTTDAPFSPTVTVDLTAEVTGGVVTPSVQAFSSELTAFGREAVHAVDGSGMTGAGGAGSVHIQGEGGVAWTTAGNLGGGFGTDLDPEITFDLGEVLDIATIREWGYNSGLVIAPGAKITLIGPDLVEIFAGPTLETMISRGTVNFAEAAGIDGYAGNDIDVTLVGVRFIRLDILTNHDGAVFDGTGTMGGAIDGRSLTGLSEIRFETGSAAPFAITDISYDPDTGAAVITFNSVPGGLYALDASATLATGDWTELSDFDSQGTSTTVCVIPPGGVSSCPPELTFTALPASLRLFRVREFDD